MIIYDNTRQYKVVYYLYMYLCVRIFMQVACALRRPGPCKVQASCMNIYIYICIYIYLCVYIYIHR